MLSSSKRWWGAACLAVPLACTIAWLLLDQRLAEQTDLRRQVWLTGDFEGAPFINDLSPDATLDFLDNDARLPRRFFSARWQGYWYVPSSQFVRLHVEADDFADVWIDGELRFARSIAAARGIRLDAGVHELRIDYRQYGGALQLSLQVGRAGAYPRPLGTEYLFPDQPAPGALRLLTVTAWLRDAAGLTWALSALAAALILLRRRGRDPTNEDGVLPVSLPTRYDAMALTGLCLAMGIVPRPVDLLM